MTPTETMSNRRFFYIIGICIKALKGINATISFTHQTFTLSATTDSLWQHDRFSLLREKNPPLHARGD